MRFSALFACAAAALGTSSAHAQYAPTVAAEAPDDLGDIIVTARKRNETQLDVPVALSVIPGDMLISRNIGSVREAAVLSPGLNISSDGIGRAFIAIRGVGVTLVQTVQPGVGLFVDGIYRPNTAYLNNPLLDIERIEVLRGPQGTLYGKNTLGGAINVITRQPGNRFEARGNASHALPDNGWLVSGSVSGPIAPDKLAVRIAASHQQQDGFINNVTIGGKANPFNADSVNATVRATPGEDVSITVNGYYDWLKGTNSPYVRVAGPTDYSRANQYNALGTALYRYRGVSARIETPLGLLETDVTLLVAYDARSTSSPDADGDFGPTDTVRSTTTDRLRSRTAELRFDTRASDRFSTLFGIFYSRERMTGLVGNLISSPVFPAPITNTTLDSRIGDTYAAFGTAFWKPDPGWEIALGLRYDRERRKADGMINGVAIPVTRLKSDEAQPKLTVTRHWDSRFMTYASVARGYRGGGFNRPTAPVRVYSGDSAWTYELGSKYAEHGFSLSGALFYNDYSNYIGLNSIAPAVGTTGGVVTVDLNSGDVESYGAEVEFAFRPTSRWSISGGLTYVHARLTNTTPYTAVTGKRLSSNHLTTQPDWLFNLSSDYAVPVGDDAIVLRAGVNGKSRRLAATLNETMATFLKGYMLVNGAISYRTGPFEFALFGNNLFNRKYFESYIEKTTLQRAGLPRLTGVAASDIGIVGDRRRYGIRASFKY